MATVVFTPKLAPVAQVTHTTLDGSVAGTDSVTRNGKTVTNARATSNAASATALHAKLVASTEPEFDEVTWTDDLAGKITWTVKDSHKGKPVTFTFSNSGAGTFGGANPTTGTVATANQGPRVLQPGNTSGGAAPGAGDTLIFRANTKVPLYYLLDNWTGVGTLARLSIDDSWTQPIGPPAINDDQAELELITNGFVYADDRVLDLTLAATLVDVGKGGGLGPNQNGNQFTAGVPRGGITRCRLDLKNVQTTIRGYHTGKSIDPGYHAVRIKAAHASNIFIGTGEGSYDLGPDKHASIFQAIAVADKCEVRCGEGTTLGSLEVGGSAKLTIDVRTANSTGNVTRLEVRDQAECFLYGLWDGASNTHGNLTETVLLGGTLHVLGGVRFRKGSLVSLVLRPGSTIDFSKCSENVTIADEVELHEPCNWIDPNQVVNYGGFTFKRFEADEGDERPGTFRCGKRYDFSINTLSLGP